MRQVSRAMAQAFVRGTKTTGIVNNTQVAVIHSGKVELWFHGGRIAWRDETGTVFLTLAGWASAATRERLNALCIELRHDERRFHQQDHMQYFGCDPIHSNQVIPLNLGTLSRMIFEMEHAA